MLDKPLTVAEMDNLRDQLACAVEDAAHDPDGWAACYLRDVGRLFGVCLAARAAEFESQAAITRGTKSAGISLPPEED